MTERVDGIYTVYLTGKAGQGLAMLVLREGRIAGANAMGGTYDGRYADADEDKLSVTLTMTLPPNVPLIQGGVTEANGETSDLSFQLPRDFESLQFVRVDTKRGPINAKVVKLRGFDD